MARPRIKADRPSPHRYCIENGRLRLDFDLRSEFPYFNFLWLFDDAAGDYRRYCNFGVEAMPRPLPPPGPTAPGMDDVPPFNVWLMGHDYKVKELALTARRAQVQVAYPPPMVVVGELSTLSGGRNLATFPDWGPTYWETVESRQASVQALWSLEAGAAWVDLAVRTAFGDLLSIMPMLLHGFCGHDDIPRHVFAGGEFLNAQGPDGSWPSHFELFDGTRAERAQLDLREERFFVFFSERPGSTTLVVALHAPHPEGFFFLGRNESPVDEAGDQPYFLRAARRGDYFPERVHARGFNDQTLFLDVGAASPPTVRLAFYPDTPLPYGDASALRAFIAGRPELAALRDAAGAAFTAPEAEWPKGPTQQ